MRTHDADDFGVRQAELGGLFAEPGPWDETAPPEDKIRRLVGEIVWRHKGRKAPVSIAEIMSRTGVMTAREVKGIVLDLVMEHSMSIGSTRGGPGDDFGGYYVIEDKADLDAAVKPFEAQAEAMQKRVSKLRDLAAARGIV
jgi:hypothetical protein